MAGIGLQRREPKFPQSHFRSFFPLSISQLSLDDCFLTRAKHLCETLECGDMDIGENGFEGIRVLALADKKYIYCETFALPLEGEGYWIIMVSFPWE